MPWGIRNPQQKNIDFSRPTRPSHTKSLKRWDRRFPACQVPNAQKELLLVNPNGRRTVVQKGLLALPPASPKAPWATQFHQFFCFPAPLSFQDNQGVLELLGHNEFAFCLYLAIHLLQPNARHAFRSFRNAIIWRSEQSCCQLCWTGGPSILPSSSARLVTSLDYIWVESLTNYQIIIMFKKYISQCFPHSISIHFCQVAAVPWRIVWFTASNHRFHAEWGHMCRSVAVGMIASEHLRLQRAV